jgi:hypothetical protein
MLYMCTTFVSELKQKRNGTGSGNKRESNLEKKGAKLGDTIWRILNFFANPDTTRNRFLSVLLPFLFNVKSRGYAAILSFCFGVMPPMPILGRSLL